MTFWSLITGMIWGMLHFLTSDSFLVLVLLCIIQSFCCCCFISVFQLFDLKPMFNWGHVHLSTYRIFFLEQQFIHYSVFSSVVSIEVGIYWECFILAICCLFLFKSQAFTISGWRQLYILHIVSMFRSLYHTISMLWSLYVFVPVSHYLISCWIRWYFVSRTFCGK